MLPRDIEVETIAYLKSQLGYTSVATRVPQTVPDGFVKVNVTGGNRTNLVTDSALVTVQVWHKDETEAFDRCRRAFAALWEWPEHASGVRRPQSVGFPVYFPDPLTDKPRFQATVSLDFRPEED